MRDHHNNQDDESYLTKNS